MSDDQMIAFRKRLEITARKNRAAVGTSMYERINLQLDERAKTLEEVLTWLDQAENGTLTED